MPTDRILIEIITAANMAGVEQAKAGFLGMNASTLALGASLGALIFIGKSAIENTEAQEKAHKSLAQAADAGKLSFDQLQTAFDKWAESNKRYIPDQYAAEEALAAFVRAGASAPDAMRELNDALDLATIKGSDLATSQQMITLALAGNARGLKTLGITTEEYSAIMKDKALTEEQKHLALLTLIETKTKDGRKAQTDFTQSTQAMNKDWQDITTKVGPPLLSLITFLVGKVDDFVTALNNLGHNKDWNLALYMGFGKVQDAIVATVAGVRELIDGIKWLIDNGGKVANFLGGGGGGGAHPSRLHAAAGGFEGMVSSPTLFLAGEAGPESVHISPMGGRGGGGNTYNIHIDQGAYIDGPGIDMLTNRIAQRLAALTGL